MPRELAVAVSALAVLALTACVLVAVQDPTRTSLAGGWTDILAEEAAKANADPCACPKCVPQVVVMDTGGSKPPNPLNPFNPLFDARGRRHLLQASSGEAAAAASSGSAAAAASSGGSAAAASGGSAAAAASSAGVALGADGRPATCAPCVCNPVVYDGDVGSDIPPNPLNPFNPLFDARRSNGFGPIGRQAPRQMAAHRPVVVEAIPVYVVQE